MAITLRPIRTKRPVVSVNGRNVFGRLRDAGADAVGKLSAYPPARTRYRRTGTLGRGWTMEGPREERGGLAVTAGNKTVYAGPVQGRKSRRPRQRPVFHRYGWPNVEDVAKEVWREHRPKVMAALQGR
jgi:hypothetical protein